ncbi:spore germination protein [Ruminiclostridium papyrosolvens]|uniref:Spore germination protein KA n=1 Tax=Ruminiclostridium papyrosolvens C7 TaxID=1330534 RepID=U4R5I5_9FIRM|nr:spore germination protein [Ruminiclostridium papyrosolvens]EPR13305.1 spore germination protein KA [Ruminiclostridium papyrosolvens C7]
MFKKLSRFINFVNDVRSKQRDSNKPSPDNVSYAGNGQSLHESLDENSQRIKKALGKSDDIIIRKFNFGVKHQTKALICFIDGLGDKNLILEYVVKSLMVNIHITNPHGNLVDKRNMFNDIKDNILSIVEATEVKNMDESIDTILSGNTLLLIDGCTQGFSVSAKGGERRSIQQPETEVVIRGSREAFVETLRVNTSLIRKIIKNPNLIFETLVVGKQTRTDVCIAYIQGIANDKVVQEVRDRINRIDTDVILESGYIEQFIEDNPLSPFATIGNSERPDKVSAKLLEGRVAILCGGTPIVLTVPYTFVESLQVPEDYYSRPYLTNFIRILRVLALFITLTLPALYISLTTFHQEMIPTVLLVTFAAAREGIPFPVLIETLISEIIFQFIRESGIRMPKAVGTAVSIVGTLVIGQAAVQAGIIGAPMVIITALSAITSFILPSIYDALIILKFLMIFISSAFGLFGVIVGMFCILAHMCSLRTFGTPYMAPLAPINWSDLKDSVFRFPLWIMKNRPKAITWKKSSRQSSKQMPNKPDKKKGGKNY